MSENSVAILQAVDRLNRWARSKGIMAGMGGMARRRRIYEIKRQAIELADREFACTHRPLSTLTTCRGCGGTGNYTDWEGNKFPWCRQCGSKGVIRLHFVETLIATWNDDPFSAFARTLRWHSPRERWPLSDHRLGPETSDVGWSVNQPGEEMELDDVARDFLLCDEAFPRGRYRNWGDRCHERCDCSLHYELPLGRAKSRCAHCHGPVTPEDVSRSSCHKTLGRVEFSFIVCAECRLTLPGVHAWFNVGIPDELLVGENVRRWVELKKLTIKEGQAA